MTPSALASHGRDKLVPQYNAMIAEIYQTRHRITALETADTKTRDIPSRQRFLSIRASGLRRGGKPDPDRACARTQNGGCLKPNPTGQMRAGQT